MRLLLVVLGFALSQASATPETIHSSETIERRVRKPLKLDRLSRNHGRELQDEEDEEELDDKYNLMSMAGTRSEGLKQGSSTRDGGERHSEAQRNSGERKESGRSGEAPEIPETYRTSADIAEPVTRTRASSEDTLASSKDGSAPSRVQKMEEKRAKNKERRRQGREKTLEIKEENRKKREEEEEEKRKKCPEYAGEDGCEDWPVCDEAECGQLFDCGPDEDCVVPKCMPQECEREEPEECTEDQCEEILTCGRNCDFKCDRDSCPEVEEPELEDCTEEQCATLEECGRDCEFQCKRESCQDGEERPQDCEDEDCEEHEGQGCTDLCPDCETQEECKEALGCPEGESCDVQGDGTFTCSVTEKQCFPPPDRNGGEGGDREGGRPEGGRPDGGN